MASSPGVLVTGVTMPMLKDVLVKAVRQWKEGNERGDVNALIRKLDATLSPLVAPSMPKVPRHPR